MTEPRSHIYGAWRGFPEKASLELLRNSRSRRLKAGQSLFEVGDAGNGLYILKKGLLKVVLKSPDLDDDGVIISLLIPDAVVGDLALIDDLPRAASVVALTDSDLRFISRSSFERYAEDYPEIYKELAMILANRLRQTNEAVAANTFLTVEGRVAHALLEVAKVFGQWGARGVCIRDTIRQKDLAAMAGVTRETVNRVLAEWERSKLVTKSMHSYVVPDPELLARKVAQLDC